MAMMFKYKVLDVAKDFNVQTKVITQILGEYLEKPKTSSQALDIPELDIIFEALTQRNQVENFADIFKVEKPAPKQEEAASAEPQAGTEKTAGAKTSGSKGDGKQSASVEKKPAAQQQSKPDAQPAQQPKKKENKPHVPRQVAEKRVVDTRGGTAANLEKYNEKFEDMAGNKTNSGKMRGGSGGGSKERIKSQAKQRQQAQQQSPQKRRQEERDRQNRLQRELAKKD